MSEAVKVVELSFLISFLIGLCLGPVVIPFLKKLKFGQYIRDEGPEAHKSKSGTPTMGGVMFLLALTVSVVSCYVVFGDKVGKCIPILLVTLGFGIVGFIDDYIKVVMKRNLGLRAWQKMALQIIVSGVFAYYLVCKSGLGSETLIPFTGGKMIDLGMLYIPAVIFIIVGTANGSNFTDGLDGLATCVTMPIAVFFGIVSLTKGYGVEAICIAFAGALLAFYVFNVNPARVFMGDTGSLALGGFVASTAFMLKMPIIIVVVAFIYFAEVCSVIIQVLYFKATGGKRFFKMAPIHHHFELCGFAETQVVTAFMVLTIALCMLSFMII